MHFGTFYVCHKSVLSVALSFFLRITIQETQGYLQISPSAHFGPAISAFSVSVFQHGRPSKCTAQYMTE